MTHVADVAPDGSPVDVYLKIPAEPDLGRVRSVIRPGCSVLDLGSGVGRIANPLVAEGHAVVAVDDSAEMLEHVGGAERVQADIWSLDLGRRFDAVLALSHLLDSRARERRLQLLQVCRRHLADDGVVVIQRYSPDWTPTEGSAKVGEVDVRLHDVVLLDDGFAAEVTYRIGDRSWTQVFESTIVDDAELATLASETGLTVLRVLDDDGAWVLLGAAP